MHTPDAKPNLLPIPTDNAARWEWVKYQLRLRGTSLAAIARNLNVTPNALHNVKQGAYPKMQRAIAAALGLQPADIWPERYVPRGRRNYSLEHTTRPGRDNGKKAVVAQTGGRR
jgi:Ner family transcriptional regulator